MRIYSLLDRKMGDFGQLFIAQNDESIVRGLADAFSSGDSLPAKHPEDFDLFCLGSYAVETGVVTGRAPVLVKSLERILSPGGGV